MPEIVRGAGLATAGDPEDVLRSLRRYVALTLGSPPWTVRIQRTRVSDDERPVAIIDESGTLTTLQSRAGTANQGDQHKQQTYTVVCYPELATNAADARQLAGLVRSQLDAGFSRGLVTDDVPPKYIGAPWRVPLYSFDGVPVSGMNRAGPDTPYGYANVDQTFSVRPIQDAMDELRYTVVATVRMSWWQGGRVPPFSPAVKADGVSGGFSPVAP